jgi:hypothetical protein
MNKNVGAAKTEGLIGELGEGVFNHRFGGQGWRIKCENRTDDKPILLLTLDLQDPELKSLKIPGCYELPLCSYINSTAWYERQVYKLDLLTHSIVEITTEVIFSTVFDREDWVNNPLPEKKIKLKNITEEDHSINEKLYWKACENFIGGNNFIRILGSPLWLEGVEREVCECGAIMQHICCIGYENFDKYSGIIDGQPFFIGEAALYFFLCKVCLVFHVISQST